MPVFHLSDDLLFPAPVWAEPDGLLAVGGDLGEERLLLAYRMGIFPWYEPESPILWWSPDPRCILEPAAVHVSRRLRRVLRRGLFRVTMNQAFEQVIRACADVRLRQGEGTWLIPEMQQAYLRLHRLGFAHSVEVWENEQLVGGLYGVVLKPFFFAESMFHVRTDASKVALATLARCLVARDYDLLDCQLPNPHLLSMGARNIPRQEFQGRLESGLGQHDAMDFGRLRDSFPELLEWSDPSCVLLDR